MRLLIDQQSIPGAIGEFCEQVADKFEIDFEIIRKREKNLYKLTSQDFDSELRNLTSFTTIQEVLENINSNDILITDDLDLASRAFPKSATIIGSDGLVYTQERLERLTIQNHLNRIQGTNTTHRLLKHRIQSLDDQFKQTLYEYLINIETNNG